MSKSNVTVMQKFYEKFALLKANIENMTVVAVSGPEPGLVLALQHHNADTGKESVIPIARLLTKEDIDQMLPNFQMTAAIEHLFKEAIAIEARKHPSEFGHGQVHPLFSNELLNSKEFKAACGL